MVTGINFQRKKSERGASLIMMVSIIGLAFIVTVAAFLVAASNGQNTARLASAKIDIATREDVLMRVILQQTATGMLTGTAPPTWNTIMTNAVNLLHATTYVDTAELASLGLSAATLANTGDTAGPPLGIFNGYNHTEVPFGGTTGVLGVVSPYTGTVQPPLMYWPPQSPPQSPLLSSTIAVTTPQEFFLGSVYTSLSSQWPSLHQLSASNRWGRITYPNVRFGYKQPGDQTFIARQVWWRIPVFYQTAQHSVDDQGVFRSYPGVLANYVLSVYEIPSQLPISGNANLQIGNWGNAVQVSGSIYGDQVQLSGGTYNTVSSRTQVNVVSPSTVGTVTYSTTNNNFDQLGARETLALTQATPGAAPVSVVGNDGKVLLLPVMPGQPFLMPAPGTPTNWDLYARPYYRCRVRVNISGTTATLNYNSLTNATAVSPITVTVYCFPDTSTPLPLPDQIMGFPDTGTPAVYNETTLSAINMYYKSTLSTGTVPGRNILMIDVPKMVTALGLPGQLYSIYIGSNPPTATDPCIGIIGTSDLHATHNDLSTFISGLSIVSNQTLYLKDSFNTVPPKPPTSIYAPEVRYGMSGQAAANVTLTGQISVDATSSAAPSVNPLSLLDPSGASFSPASATFGEITDPNYIPPISRISLMFTIEKEHTN